MRISCTLLKKGAEAGLNLSQIGQILCRPDEDDEEPSLLEQIVRKARMCANMMAQIQTRIKDSNLRLILPTIQQAQNTNTRRYSMANNSLLDEDDDLLDVNFINQYDDSSALNVDMNSMEVDTLDMLNLKSSLKEQERLSEARRGRTDSSIAPASLELHGGFGAGQAAAADPIKEVEPSYLPSAREREDRLSPIPKFKDTEERGNEASLRLVPVPTGEDCAPSEGKASVLAQNSSPRNQSLSIRKRTSLVRKRGYSDIDQNNYQAFRLNTEAALEQSTSKIIQKTKDQGHDKKLKTMRQKPSTDEAQE